MKLAFLLVAAWALLLLPPPKSVIAKNASIGIYAIVDQVTFEPETGPPNSVRISGTFVVPVPVSSGNYRSPQRGYLYFRIAPRTEQATRRDWSELKTLAGSGKVVGFGQYWVPNSDDSQGNPHHSLEVTVHAVGASIRLGLKSVHRRHILLCATPLQVWVVGVTRKKLNLCKVSVEKHAVPFLNFFTGPVLQNKLMHNIQSGVDCRISKV